MHIFNVMESDAVFYVSYLHAVGTAVVEVDLEAVVIARSRPLHGVRPKTRSKNENKKEMGKTEIRKHLKKYGEKNV